jgi:hypothetical protein
LQKKPFISAGAGAYPKMIRRQIRTARFRRIFFAAVLIPNAAIAVEVHKRDTATPGYVRAQSDGVTLEAHAVRDQIVFCFNAEKDLKISAQYGVQFNVGRIDLKLWSEPFPKTVTAADWYFDLPLQINLKTRGDLRERRVHVDLGACSPSHCTPITFEIIVPPYQSVDRTNPRCAN